MDKTKPFEISKYVVWEAYERVKANKGAAGIDDVVRLHRSLPGAQTPDPGRRE